MKNKKIVFMGTPDFAIPSLEKLIDECSVVGVITQPDRPAGRGKGLQSPPVKEISIIHGLELIQPTKLSDSGVYEKIQSWEPDAIVVVAFGQILKENILNLPKFGCINLHGSLLPRWRGAAPIQNAILNGDLKTGITIMKMDLGIDTGPILQQRSIPIEKDDTSASLSKKLAVLGADLLTDVLAGYFNGKILPVHQPEDGVTYAPVINKQNGFLDFSKSSVALERQIRAFTPWPGSFMVVGSDRIKIVSVKCLPEKNLPPGDRSVINGYPVVGTKDGILVLEQLQPAGKKIIQGKEFLNGFRGW